MSLFCCEGKKNCTCISIIISAIVGIVASFLQIGGLFIFIPLIAVVFLAVAILFLLATLIAAGLGRITAQYSCVCSALNALLTGIIGTVITSIIVLAFGIIAIGVISSIFTGLLVFFTALMILSTVCLIKAFANCTNC